MGASPRTAAALGGAAPLTVARAALLLALLLGLQPVATDVYLPALPALTRDLGANLAQAQLTMSALLLAFGSSQLFWGPVADRVGRRPVLLAGLTLFVIASIATTLAPDMGALIAGRIVQGVAMAASVVCARAMVRDLYEPVQGARVMSLGMSGLALLAISGPLLGGATAAAWGWRGTMALVTLGGVATLAVIAFGLPETLRPERAAAARAAPALPSLLNNWRSMLAHPVFRAWTLLVACSYGGLFTILAGSPFVYIEVLGLSPVAHGGALALGAAVYLGATFLCRRWVARHGMAGTVVRGAGFSLAAGALALAALAAPPAWQLAGLLAAHALHSLGHGMHQPCGQAGAVGPFPAAAGAASALAGFALALLAFAIGHWLGATLDGSVRPFALCLAFWSVVTALVAWTVVRRHAGT